MSTTEMEKERGPESKEFYIWEPPGKHISIHLNFNVIDQIAQEAMQGLGAVPRRGVEVGGVLLGTVSAGDPRVIKIDDFAVVKCEYASGPSYSLSDNDRRRMEAALRKWPRGPERPDYVVGFFRSHTRKDLFLSDEDLALFSQYFSKLNDVILLIHPFVTHTSQAGFFFWENDKIERESSCLEFPFSRKELGGGAAPKRRSNRDRPAEVNEEIPELTAAGDRDAGPVHVPRFVSAEPRRSFDWGKWILLALLFLSVGGFLGFVAAPYFRDRMAGTSGENPYSLGFTAITEGDHLHIKWNRNGPLIQNARGGRITIVDNGSTRVLDLDPRQLKNGTVIYRKIGNQVDLRMEVFVEKQGSVAENVEVRGQ